MRAGVIIGGRCIMAPSQLDIRKDADAAFVQMCRNGLLIVEADGTELPQGVEGYNEDAQTITQLIGHGDGPVMRSANNMRAYPGTIWRERRPLNVA